MTGMVLCERCNWVDDPAGQRCPCQQPYDVAAVHWRLDEAIARAQRSDRDRDARAVLAYLVVARRAA